MALQVCIIMYRDRCDILKVEIITGRVLREKLGASTPAKVARMSKSLTALRSQFDTGVAVQIAMVSFRMHEDVTTLRESSVFFLRHFHM